MSDTLEAMSMHPETNDTYNTSASELAEFFAGHGARTDDIERAIALAGAGRDTRAIEIGCGNGRDAEEIIPKVGWYEGFDPSEGMLRLARQRLADTSFVEADALTYDYPKNIDVIFAFASLLHIGQRDLAAVFDKVHTSLKSNGIFYIELKERPEYTEELQTDQFGERMFYFYNPDLIRSIAGTAFTSVHERHYRIGKTDWFTMALEKQ